MNDNNYWYNVKEENGNIVINKCEKTNYYSNNNVEKKKRNWKPALTILAILVILPFFILFFFNIPYIYGNSTKSRTFMIYMVGSDLETNGGIASYDLKDINGHKIDLENNNVVLMAGGSKKWHNFVNEDEIGIYKLSSSGFIKIDSKELTNMGSVDLLGDFLEYSYNNQPAEKYDLIFWNHGLGSLGLEVDELSDDYLNISELNEVFEKSPFSKDKLEVVIFNNCLAANIHFASVMKNYAEYMVASEEVMYVGQIIDRLNFLGDIKRDSTGYDVGLAYVEESDSSVDHVNKTTVLNIDSTLSIIDLSKVEELENEMNKFFSTIDLDSNYQLITRARRKTQTYGIEDFTFDTVDLYSLADSLSIAADSSALSSLKESIKDTVKYNSTTNDYSNGISIYFPYYGSSEYIATHLYYFDKLWNNDYTNFIHKFVSKANSARRANRAGEEDSILELTNSIRHIDNLISLELTDKELDGYQDANIYIFSKENDIFNLLLKSDQVKLNNKNLEISDIRFLKTSNNEMVSSIYENGMYKIYGSLNESDVLLKVSSENGNGVINNVFVDSKDKPIGGLIEYNDENISYYSIKYDLLEDDKINKEWESTSERYTVNNKNNDLSIVGNDLTNYYILIEMHDENNDVYYSKLTKID